MRGNCSSGHFCLQGKLMWALKTGVWLFNSLPILLIHKKCVHLGVQKSHLCCTYLNLIQECSESRDTQLRRYNRVHELLAWTFFTPRWSVWNGIWMIMTRPGMHTHLLPPALVRFLGNGDVRELLGSTFFTPSWSVLNGIRLITTREPRCK